MGHRLFFYFPRGSPGHLTGTQVLRELESAGVLDGPQLLPANLSALHGLLLARNCFSLPSTPLSDRFLCLLVTSLLQTLASPAPSVSVQSPTVAKAEGWDHGSRQHKGSRG